DARPTTSSYTASTVNHAEENRQREHDAATRIQSWFRACKVRAYVRLIGHDQKTTVMLGIFVRACVYKFNVSLTF
uniref:Uncharacterized protein n=1 Tax=Mastacembelus armatus TaxID=205130 RepID=A0A7N8Y7H4_9TELE